MPLATLATGQLWCVQIELNALNVPFTGCVTTTCCGAKIFPPPTGISSVVPRMTFAGAGVGVPRGSPYLAQPVTVASPAATSKVRRLVSDTGGPFNG